MGLTRLSDDLAIVAIGRNEGNRLRICLRSLPSSACCVYVDSGSSDDSVSFAHALGVNVVELLPGTRFTAALARNAGIATVERLAPDVLYINMVDGDCELDPNWIKQGVATLAAHPDIGVVFGRNRERFPEASLYNRLCDDEWNGAVGETKSCGGNALYRYAALKQVGAFDPSLIAGEEPDLCLRMRAAGWRVWRIDAEMTRHDAAIYRLGQWWRRMERGGHAFAELATRHGAKGDPDWRWQVRSIIGWGISFPALVIFVGVAVDWRLGILVASLWPAQIARIGLRKRRGGHHAAFALTISFFLMLGKFAQAKGMLSYFFGKWGAARFVLIEYKKPPAW